MSLAVLELENYLKSSHKLLLTVAQRVEGYLEAWNVELVTVA